MYEDNKVPSVVRHILSIYSPSAISVGENGVASFQLRWLVVPNREEGSKRKRLQVIRRV